VRRKQRENSVKEERKPREGECKEQRRRRGDNTVGIQEIETQGKAARRDKNRRARRNRGRSKAHIQQGRSAPPPISFLQVCSFPFFAKIDACLSRETKGKQKTKEKPKDRHFCTL